MKKNLYFQLIPKLLLKKNTPKGKKEGQVRKKNKPLMAVTGKLTYYAPLFLNIRTSEGVCN